MRATIVVTGTLVVGLLFLQGPQVWDEVQLRTGIGLPNRTLGPMEIVAHRGDVDHYPEDTLEAIVAATESGADGVEFDVHRSADGTWWVIHDPTLDATTTGSGAISQLPDDLIASATVDAGFGFDPVRHRGLKVPTLRAVLRALDKWDGHLYIDLQHSESGSVAEIAALLGGRAATILCRDKEDVDAVVASGGDLNAIARKRNEDAAHVLDGWLVDAHREVTPDIASASSLPYVTYVDEAEYGDDESDLLRRAWASDVEAFLTKHLADALLLRRSLEAPG